MKNIKLLYILGQLKARELCFLSIQWQELEVLFQCNKTVTLFASDLIKFKLNKSIFVHSCNLLICITAQ